MALKPDFGPDGRDFPPLPTIHSSEIEQRVYTHRSLHARPTHVFEDHPSDLSPDNENSLRYKLPDRLRSHPAQAVTLRASTHIQADVLESFIGGLYQDQGIEAVRCWLDPLFTPYAAAAYQKVRLQHGLPILPMPQSPQPSITNTPTPMTTIGHLSLFNQHLQQLDRPVEWVYSDVSEEVVEVDEATKNASKMTPVWYVKVLVDGELYGNGRGNTKKAARNEAAKIGLERLGVIV
ncbi:hypothetical protein C0993_001335 [Termitomyces sp. T159_Od127]|nr:hypothetical protein C0993_001335 [Termitomyces sp. T159_Od127]